MSHLFATSISHLSLLVASVYNSSSYNSSTYNGQDAGASSSSNLLTNTGFDVSFAVTIAALLILAAVVVRIWKRPNRSASL